MNNQTATLACRANLDTELCNDIIKATYRQVFGNRYMMELDVCSSIEALFRNGDLTVQGMVTAFGQSDSYRRIFLESNNPYRFVELNIKHFLGRAPRNQQEISEHVTRLAEEGFEADISSYIYSAEYINNFGIDTVPYNRAALSTVGGDTIGYNRNKVLNKGYAGYDGSEKSSLLTSLAANLNPAKVVTRKPVGGGGLYTIAWTTRIQLGAVRRTSQKSTVRYNSLSNTIKSIQAQGGTITAIDTN
ncbi:MAG: phycobilisome rod-core linker polypeptide [Cyanobacteria bacterium]|nr:phycobilisome rod-core linker polypeptide [Cyanobacteriota bacterium]